MNRCVGLFEGERERKPLEGEGTLWVFIYWMEGCCLWWGSLKLDPFGVIVLKVEFI